MGAPWLNCVQWLAISSILMLILTFAFSYYAAGYQADVEFIDALSEKAEMDFTGVEVEKPVVCPETGDVMVCPETGKELVETVTEYKWVLNENTIDVGDVTDSGTPFNWNGKNPEGKLVDPAIKGETIKEFNRIHEIHRESLYDDFKRKGGWDGSNKYIEALKDKITPAITETVGTVSGFAVTGLTFLGSIWASRLEKKKIREALEQSRREEGMERDVAKRKYLRRETGENIRQFHEQVDKAGHVKGAVSGIEQLEEAKYVCRYDVIIGSIVILLALIFLIVGGMGHFGCHDFGDRFGEEHGIFKVMFIQGISCLTVGILSLCLASVNYFDARAQYNSKIQVLNAIEKSEDTSEGNTLGSDMEFDPENLPSVPSENSKLNNAMLLDEERSIDLSARGSTIRRRLLRPIHRLLQSSQL